MKKCPNCNQLFTDDNMFCLNDGTSLLLVSETGQNPTIFPTSGEMPTQFIQLTPNAAPIPPNAAPNNAKDSSKWLFLIIGILATAVIGMGIFMFTMRGEKKETVSQNTKTENAPENTSRAETFVAKTAPSNLNNNVSQTFQPKINPNLSPGGNWSGDWSSKTTKFTATANLTETDGKVSGQIVWTLQRTSNPKKTDKVGLSATEYVQGTYNQATRTVNLKGYRKDDPNNIVILDKYNLSLAENNLTLSGRSINGNFVLRR